MPTPPYDTLEAILNSARVRLNDAIVAVGGDILTDVATFTPQFVSNAWRRLQEYLSDRGFAALNEEALFFTVPATTSSDPATFVWFNWTQYFDGTNPQTAPVLPQSMISPLELFERVSGSNTQFWPMDQMFNGLPTANVSQNSGARANLNKCWEWRQETIYLPGAIGNTDIRMRFAAYIADFLIGVQDYLQSGMNSSQANMPLVSGATIANGQPNSGYFVQVDQEKMQIIAGGGTDDPTVLRGILGTVATSHSANAQVGVLGNGIPVPIMRCLNSFSWYLCQEVAGSRGDLDAAGFQVNAEGAAEQIWNRDYRQGKTLFQRAELGKMGDQRSHTQGANAPVAGLAPVGGA